MGNHLRCRGWEMWMSCRIVLEDGLWPEHEITFRRFISPDQFLDRLVWGYTDPKAPMLLEKALEFENKLNSR